MAREPHRHGTAFVVGATLGGVAGAVWGLLNATETGDQARAALGRRLEAGADRLVVAAADLEVSARQWLARGELSAPAGVAYAMREAAAEPAGGVAAVEPALPEVEGAGAPDETVG